MKQDNVTTDYETQDRNNCGFLTSLKSLSNICTVNLFSGTV